MPIQFDTRNLVESRINRFFDLVKLLAERLPVLHNLIVESAGIGLLRYAVYATFHRYP